MNSQHMATATQIQSPVNEHPRGAQLTPGTQTPGETALVASPHPAVERESVPLSAAVSRLPVELEVSIPLREFRVRNLLNLGPEQVIETQWSHDEDMPLVSGAVQLAWSEFEVIDSKLAVRITRIA
jgi:flagellar motor switch protein FliN/FliY